MRSSHTAAAVSAVFDDANLVGYGGLEPVVRLAERCGLPDLVSGHVRISGAANSGGANADAKVLSLVAGMTAGADSIDDIDRLRHGGMGLLFDGARAPSTGGRFCGRSPMGTTGSSTRYTGPSWPGWLPRRICCPAVTG